MKMRHYIPNYDSQEICKWVQSEKEHAIWCANKFPYPLLKNQFDIILKQNQDEWNDEAFVVVDEEDKVIGFFCYSLDCENVAYLKYVLIAPTFRNRGLGKQMIALALNYANDILGATAVQMNVFHINYSALKCYTQMQFKTKIETADAFKFQDEFWNRINMWYTF